MLIKTLKLVNFRNFSTVDLNFDKTTLLLGKNAQGKSNLLESIYFLATTKSPRADLDLQLIKEGEGTCLVEGEIGENHEATKLEIAMQTGPETGFQKRTRVNGVPRRTTDYLGHLIAVHFCPEDINLVTGPPALRRWHLDLTLAQIDREYKLALTEYHLALTARNKLLKRIKEGLSKLNELDFWTDKMVQNGKVVGEKRQAFFQNLGQQKIDNKFRFVYQENHISPERVRDYLPKEVAAGMSLIGPHRDDFIFKLDGRDLASFGSRGEQRTAVLNLKLAELQFIKEKTGFLPILLLDDVFSELDQEHRDYVISATSGQQTILSAVEQEQIPASFLKSAQVIKVNNGTLK